MHDLALSELYRFRPADPPDWVGTDNYDAHLHRRPEIRRSRCSVTLTFVLFSVPLKLAFALGVALLLNRGMRGLPVYRALFYLPTPARRLGGHRDPVAPAVFRRRAGEPLPRHFRHPGPELDFQPALFAVDADRARRSGSSARR